MKRFTENSTKTSAISQNKALTHFHSPRGSAAIAFLQQLELNHRDSAETQTPRTPRGVRTNKGRRVIFNSWAPRNEGKPDFSDMLRTERPPPPPPPPVWIWWICSVYQEKRDRAGRSSHPRHTSNRKWLPGWLMSVDYCHRVGCCSLQSTAASPIGQLRLNGQHAHNEAQG